jgi:hypothetical protein
MKAHPKHGDVLLLLKFNKRRRGFLQLFISVMYLTCAVPLSYSQAFSPNLHIDYKNNFLSLSAQKADLQNVLMKISEKTGIYVRFPSSLKKQITAKMVRVSLWKALSKILKGTNYAIIYSGSGNNRTAVSEVFVYGTSKGSSISDRSTLRENLIASRIRSYEKQLRLMNKKLSQIGKNSRLGKRYSSQIRAYENIIENLKRKIK